MTFVVGGRQFVTLAALAIFPPGDHPVRGTGKA